MTTHPTLTDRDMKNLHLGDKIRFGGAELVIEGHGDDARFVMTGSSGKHTLLVAATDLERLQAHWIGFCEQNQAPLNTNIKGLPEGRSYFTEKGWSQQYPWVEVKRTAQTVTLAKVIVKEDPEWTAKREFIPGGFAGHTPNQHQQTWLFDRIDEAQTVRISMTKRGWAKGETLFVENTAREFYDYNF